MPSVSTWDRDDLRVVQEAPSDLIFAKINRWLFSDSIMLLRPSRIRNLVVGFLFLHLGSLAAQTGSSSSLHATFSPQPEYPEEARRHHLEGHGTFILTIEPDGPVSSVNAAEGIGAPLLDKAAIAAFLRWQFPPQTESHKVRVPLTFTLNKNEPDEGSFPAKTDKTIGDFDVAHSANPTSLVFEIIHFASFMLPNILLLAASIILLCKNPRLTGLFHLAFTSSWFLVDLFDAGLSSPLVFGRLGATLASFHQSGTIHLGSTSLLTFRLWCSILNQLFLIVFTVLLLFYALRRNDVPRNVS